MLGTCAKFVHMPVFDYVPPKKNMIQYKINRISKEKEGLEIGKGK